MGAAQARDQVFARCHNLTSSQLIRGLSRLPQCKAFRFFVPFCRLLRLAGDTQGPIRCRSPSPGPPRGERLGKNTLFVCGISLTSGQLINELFPDCLKVKLFALVLRYRGGDHIYDMRCSFVAVGLNARFIVLPHWDNMSQAHMIFPPVTLY